MLDTTCSVDGCEQPRRKRTWCASHYSQWRRTGSVAPFTYKWGDGSDGCRQCGEPCERTYCSSRCKALWHYHQGARPDAVECVGCGLNLSLADSGKAGRRRRADVKLCKRCRQDKSKHGVSVLYLAARDGTDCGICHLPVDMTLAFPDSMRPSVDHIKPRARGGTNDESNLQLAHLHCNRVKSDRVDA